MKAVILSDPLNGFGLDLASDLARLGYFVIGIAKNSKESQNIKKSVLKRYQHSQIETFVGELDNIKNVSQVLLNIKLVMTNYNLDSIYAYIGNHHIFEKRLDKNENDIENQFFENYLAHFMIAYSLMPYLQKQPNSKIILPVLGNGDVGNINFKDLFHEKKYDGAEAFKTAKLANAIIAGEFNRRYNTGDNPVQTVLYQEKIVSTEEELNVDPEVKGIKKLFAKNDRMDRVYKGIEAILNIRNHGENLFYKFSKPKKLPTISFNKDLGQKLYELSEKMAKLKY
jgi:hypothetical protein